MISVGSFDIDSIAAATKKVQVFEIHFAAMKMLAEYYIDLRDVQSAIKTYEFLKRYTEDNKRYKEKLKLYEQLGYCHRLLREHSMACFFFKKQLELSWEQNNL